MNHKRISEAEMTQLSTDLDLLGFTVPVMSIKLWNAHWQHEVQIWAGHYPKTPGKPGRPKGSGIMPHILRSYQSLRL